MADTRIGYDDLFDFSNDAPIKKLKATLKEINKELERLKSQTNAKKSGLQSEAQAQAEALKKVSVSSKAATKDLKDLSKTANKTGREYEELTKDSLALSKSQTELQTTIRRLEKTYKAQLKDVKSVSRATEEGRIKFQAMGREAVRMRAQLDEFNAGLRRNVQELRAGNNLYEQTKLRVQRLRTEYQKLVVAFRDGAPVFGKNEMRARALRREILGLETGMKKLEASTRVGIRGMSNFSSVGGLAAAGLKTFASSALAAFAGVTALVTGMQRGFEAFTTFEFNMAQVAALTESSTFKFEQLREKARELGRTTARTAGDVAELELVLTRLGTDPDEILALTEAITNLSIAFDYDLAQTASVVKRTLNAFKIEAKDSKKVVDVLAKAFATSALDLSKWETALSTVGATAEILGVDLETTVGLMSALVDSGLQVSVAATSMRNLFSQLANPMSKINQVFEGTVNSSESMLQAFEILGEEVKTLGEAAQITDKRVLGTFVTTIKNTDLIRKNAVAYKNAEGFLTKFSKRIGESVYIKVKILTSALESLAISIGDNLLPWIERSIGALTTFVQWMGTAIDKVKEWKAWSDSFVKDKAEILIEQLKYTLAIRQEKDLLDSMFATLKNDKASKEDKARAMHKILTTYKEYLGDLDIEKATIQDVLAFEERLTKQYIAKKVALEEQQEAARITEELRGRAEALSVKQAERDDEILELQRQIANWEEKVEEARKNNYVQDVKRHQQVIAIKQKMIQEIKDAQAADEEALIQTTQLALKNNKARFDSLFRGLQLERFYLRQQADEEKEILITKRLNAQELADWQEMMEEKWQSARAKLLHERNGELQVLQVAYYDGTIATKEEYLKRLADVDEDYANQENIMLQAHLGDMISFLEKHGEQTAALRVQLEEAKAEELLKIDSDEFDAEVASLHRELEFIKVKTKIQQEKNQALSDLNEQWRNGELRDEDAYKKELARIDRNSNIELVAEEIDHLTKLIEIRRKAGENYTDLILEIFQLEEKLMELRREKATKESSFWEENSKEIAQAAIQGFNSVARELLMAQNEEFRNAMDYQKKLINDRYEHEKIAAGDNARVLQLVEARKQKELSKLAYKEAAFRKKQARNAVILETAVAVARALAQGGIPAGLVLAGIAAAAGAIQLAIVEGVSIPAFEKGTESAPGGVAVAGEKGAELMKTPKGEYRMLGEKGKSKPQLYDVPKGAQIFDAIQTQKMLDTPEQTSYLKGFGDTAKAMKESAIVTTNIQNIIQRDEAQLQRAFKNAIHGLQVNETIIDTEGGFHKLTRKGNTKLKRIRDRNSFS